METLTCNFSGKTRKEVLSGREYIVAPMTMLKEGVFDGSKGPLLYDEEVLTRDIQMWNGMPIVVNHPYKEGKPITARTPSILEKQGIGFVFNANYDDALKAEAWFEVESTGRIYPQILDDLKAGRKIELSTGLFTSEVKAPANATYNGVSYKHKAVVIKADHLAVLTDEEGACSLNDGCGILVNEKTKEEKESDSVLGWIAKKLGFGAELTANEASHGDIAARLQSQLMRKFTQDEPYAYIVEVYDDYFVYRQSEDLYRLGYSKSENDVTISSEVPVKVVREVNFVTTTNSKDEEPEDMAKLKDTERNEMIESLVGNCKGCPATDKETLSKLSDDVLSSLAANAQNAEKAEELTLAANAASAGITDKEGNKYTFNAKKGEWELKPAAPVQKISQTNNQQQIQEEDEDTFLRRAPASIRSMLTNAMRIEAQQKGVLIGDLTSHLVGNSKQKMIDKLSEKTLEELEDLMTLRGGSASSEESSGANYFGQQGSFSFNRRRSTEESEGDRNTLTANEKSDILEDAEVDYEALSAEQ